MFCSNCGKELKEEWIVCPNCGQLLQKDENTEENREEIKQHKEIKEDKIGKKHRKKWIIGIIILIFIMIIIMVNDDENDEIAEKSEATESLIIDAEEGGGEAELTSENIWEDYINSCQKVTIEDIARNPQNYIGKNIIVYGSLGETMGVYSIGLWTSVHPMTVEYDGIAYDANLNPLGNILDTDYGYVIGQMTDDSTINAAIVIVSETDNLF